MSELMAEAGLSFNEALAQVRASTVFTTHTPVPAGIDRFSKDLVASYLESGLLAAVDPARALGLGLESYPAATPACSTWPCSASTWRSTRTASRSSTAG